MKMDMAAGGADQAEDAPQQGGLSGAVFPDDGEIVALLHR